MNLLREYWANGRCASIVQLRPKGSKQTGQTFTYGIYLDKKQYITCIREAHARTVFDAIAPILCEMKRKKT